MWETDRDQPEELVDRRITGFNPIGIRRLRRGRKADGYCIGGIRLGFELTPLAGRRVGGGRGGRHGKEV